MASARPVCFAITGPTASGKTDLALELARVFPLEIISMDSAMVYRGMDIGTAKPDRDILAEVPHHLIDICDPEESYSAGRFVTDCLKLVAEIKARDRLPLIVGGTMLYLKALREGIAPLPERSPDVRAEIDDRARAMGWPALHAELAAIDPAAGARIDPADRQRIQRALEVHAVTGRSISDIQKEVSASGHQVESVALVPKDRVRLGQSIALRFEQMVERGLIEEVKKLRQRPGLDAGSASMRAVGYRQIWAYLNGDCDWPEASRRAITATRQLAKRQLTWLRRDTDSARLDTEDPKRLEKLRQHLRRHLNNP